MIRVVLADDQALVRAGLRLILDAEDDIEIVAEVANGEQAVWAAGQHRPDLVLMDVRMPGMDGIEATLAIGREAAGDVGGPPVLILTTFDDDEVLWGAVRSGAAGFVLKDTPAEDLVSAIRTTAAGGSWLDPRVTPRLLNRLRRVEPRGTVDIERLTGRERDVLRLVATGATNLEIAAQLHMGERTVKTHISSIFTKLDARDRAAAIVIAYRSGLVELT